MSMELLVVESISLPPVVAIMTDGRLIHDNEARLEAFHQM
jgi:hypothetical protein